MFQMISRNIECLYLKNWNWIKDLDQIRWWNNSSFMRFCNRKIHLNNINFSKLLLRFYELNPSLIVLERKRITTTVYLPNSSFSSTRDTLENNIVTLDLHTVQLIVIRYIVNRYSKCYLTMSYYAYTVCIKSDREK